MYTDIGRVKQFGKALLIILMKPLGTVVISLPFLHGVTKGCIRHFFRVGSFMTGPVLIDNRINHGFLRDIADKCRMRFIFRLIFVVSGQNNLTKMDKKAEYLIFCTLSKAIDAS